MDEETLKLGVNATPHFIGALTEMVWAQIENTSQDLESFSKYVYDVRYLKVLADCWWYRHAGRSTITVDDVMLLSRRNDGLEAVLQSFVDKQKASKSKTAKQR